MNSSDSQAVAKSLARLTELAEEFNKRHQPMSIIEAVVKSGRMGGKFAFATEFSYSQLQHQKRTLVENYGLRSIIRQPGGELLLQGAMVESIPFAVQLKIIEFKSIPMGQVDWFYNPHEWK